MELSKEMLVDIVINITNILVLFLVVRKLAYKPVKNFMTQRTQRVLKEKEAAQTLADEAERKSDECDRIIEESTKAKEEAFKEGELLGKKEAQRIIDEANEKAKVILANADKKAEEKQKKMLEDTEDDIVSIAVDVSEKLLSREITDADNKKIVEDFLANFEGQGGKNA